MCEAGAELKSRVEKAMKGDAKPNKRRECAIRAFLDNVQPGYSDLEIEALVELLEAGITVNRPLFEHYINQPPRPEKRKTKGLTDRQDAGADACAADAADAARSGERPEFVGRKTDYLLQNAHTPEREENVSKYARSFQFEADISEVDVYNHGLHGGGIPGVVERHMAAVKKSAAKGDMSKGLRDAIDRISGERHEYLLREGEVATASG
jgi:hypothetical protein